MHLASPSSPLLPLLALASLLVPGAGAQPKGKPSSKDAILLSGVQTLTLRGGGARTAHRRVAAVPQLRCVSSPAGVCGLHAVDVMRCDNRGGGYGGPEDVHWSCAAALPPELRLGPTDVQCEGYRAPDDPYVLRGSCAVQYRLLLTELGERRFPHLVPGAPGRLARWLDRAPSVAFGVLFALVCLWIVYSAWFAADGNRQGPPPANRRPRRTWWGGGGGGFDPGFGPGGGGGGYWADPPPPYPGTDKSWGAQNQGWRPGFWSGLASGAAAGYMAGNRGGNNNRRESRGYGWGAGPSSSSSSSSSRSEARSTSSARYESTGFGTTSRR
ncbi:hypothetical protein GGS23DRAFT_619317 [Durotheca rogersii]|uniref:uncharacterized protein n=1 Tax=Durotheca rogersii TaxID=419775 RepID=UPI00221EAD6E|nr:uncharacterized protein GGS23DRAFT_619317 [Durotheca rogersii]KAI5864664.1 hypothetical protein GGS23DRAFT_619317 [Durotheca rogersii]